jgi:hypothetical protein
MEHRAEQARADFLAPILQCREPAAEIKAAMAAFPASAVERHNDAVPATEPSDFSFEFVTGHCAKFAHFCTIRNDCGSSALGSILVALLGA